MKSLKGKNILILGGTAPCVHVTQYAKEMGAYVYVADNSSTVGPAKRLADEQVNISTCDYDSLLQFVKDRHIDGILTGPGEFNIVNAMNVSKLAGLSFYCNKEQWDICQHKKHFKDFCKENGLPVVPEYSAEEVLSDTAFPVIVKPVDGCSSRGISICWNNDELELAKKHALQASPSGKIIIEKYVVNGGVTIDAKYVAINGEYYLEAIGDRYVLNGGLITAISFYPSVYYRQFMKQVHPYVKQAFSSIHLQDGAFFFQAIPDGDQVYIYEMGLRVSGGMIYKLTDATSGNNTLKMLIHHCLTGEMCEESDLHNIDPLCGGKSASTMAFPLRTGKIGSISGFECLNQIPGVIDFTRYYKEGDVIEDRHVNTLDQLFGRVMVVADHKEALMELLKTIRDRVSVKDDRGEEMIIWSTFDEIYLNAVKA